MEKHKKYHSIKQLVLHLIRDSKGNISYEALTEAVVRHFPCSKWQKSHWAWYKTQIRRGRFKTLFTKEGVALIESSARGRSARDERVKALGDPILKRVRAELDLTAGEDATLRFKLNRWVFSRLMNDETKSKRPIKQALWNSGQRKCLLCGKNFESLRGVELHRVDESLHYFEANCQLLCKSCHQGLGQS